VGAAVAEDIRDLISKWFAIVEYTRETISGGGMSLSIDAYRVIPLN